MAITAEDLHAFNRFALEQIQGNGAKLTLNELVSRWNASRKEHADAVMELTQCIEDMNAGIGRPFDEVDAELRSKHGYASRNGL